MTGPNLTLCIRLAMMAHSVAKRMQKVNSKNKTGLWLHLCLVWRKVTEGSFHYTCKTSGKRSTCSKIERFTHLYTHTLTHCVRQRETLVCHRDNMNGFSHLLFLHGVSFEASLQQYGMARRPSSLSSVTCPDAA